ncbi:MAG: efflux RND transporter periplasmic adaptor subunit [Candidatus Omnitrophota bacterium]
MITKDQIKPILDKTLKYIQENKRILKIVAVLLLVMFITVQIRGCIERNRKPAVHPRPVQTAKAFKKTVPVYVDSFGTLTSPENVDIKAQVTGKILEVNFTQGQEVSAGDLLFTIDPREYKANVDKAQGALAEQVEDLKLKTDTFERNKQLIEKDLISEQDFERYQTDMTAAAAATELAAAELELAKINLDYCYIRSPINGLTGKRQVDLGNIITANTGPVLVNVKRIDELYLDFTLPERDLVKVREAMEKNTLDVQVFIPGEEGKTYSGKLEFIDNTVDDDTGTFALRAVVKNDTRELWAGQFVTVRLILGEEKDAVLVAYDAAQIGKQGYYVFVVQKNNKADLRTVTVGSKQGSSIVIEKGVEEGETVVTVGQLGLSPGMPVVDITETVKKQEKTN